MYRVDPPKKANRKLLEETNKKFILVTYLKKNSCLLNMIGIVDD